MYSDTSPYEVSECSLPRSSRGKISREEAKRISFHLFAKSKMKKRMKVAWRGYLNDQTDDDNRY